LSPWVSIVALSAWLVLALGAFRAQRVRAPKAIAMALGWASVFFLVFAVFSAVGK